MGIGTNISYNLFDLLGGGSKGQEGQTTSSSEQLARAQEDLQKDPQNPRIIKRLAGLYIQNGQTDSAVEVLEQGQKDAPEDPAIPLYLGQAYDRKAQAQTDEDERKATYQKAGDAYAAATEIKDEPQAYLLAGQAYDQAGQPAEAIQYYNQYLDRAPKGQDAAKVKDRISALLEGKESTGSAQP
jgi:tetratricopeptide (TPR) repeat protein